MTPAEINAIRDSNIKLADITYLIDFRIPYLVARYIAATYSEYLDRDNMCMSYTKTTVENEISSLDDFGNPLIKKQRDRLLGLFRKSCNALRGKLRYCGEINSTLDILSALYHGYARENFERVKADHDAIVAQLNTPRP